MAGQRNLAGSSYRSVVASILGIIVSIAPGVTDGICVIPLGFARIAIVGIARAIRAIFWLSLIHI